MNNLLEQWNDHIIKGNQLSRELEDFEGIIGAGEEPDSEIAFVEKGIGTTYISVLSADKMAEFKQIVLKEIYDARDEKEVELKKLMGTIPVMPPSSKGVVIGVVGHGKPIPHILPPGTPGVVIPDLIANRKPAINNPEFEAAVQGMVQSVKKPDPVEDKLSEILQTETKRLEKPEDKSLDKYPAKKESRYPDGMTEEVVRDMYISKKDDFF